ncbi:MAG: hypothetical protein KGJ34_00990 [Patescibacteria group bacterium]|nr:hypothetical protein [Patescibacteria group bacterium]
MVLLNAMLSLLHKQFGVLAGLSIAIFAIFFVIAGASTAHAQDASQSIVGVNNPANAGITSSSFNFTQSPYTQTPSSLSPTLNTSQANTQAGQQILNNLGLSPQGTTGNTQTTSTSDDLGCFNGQFDLCLSGIVYFVAVAIPSFFAYEAATFLGIAVQVSLNSSTYSIGFIGSAWTVVRDVANMAFLFILIYIALVIMLEADTHNTSQTLVLVIIMALIINFSFFITRLVIDAGNILAVEVYNAIPTTQSVPGGGKDLTEDIMRAIGVQNLFSTSAFQQWNSSNGNSFSFYRLITLSCLYIATGIIVVILGFAFFIAAVNFLGRVVVLWFVIIFSPLAFVARAIEPVAQGAGEGFRQWLGALIRNALYPAVFLFVFLFLDIFMKGLALGTNGNSVAADIFQNLNVQNLQNPNSNYIMTLVTQLAMMGIELGFVVIMVKIALSAADRVGLESAAFAHKAAERFRGAYFGTYARQTAGRAAFYADRAITDTRLGNTRMGQRVRALTTQKFASKEFAAVGKKGKSFEQYHEEERHLKEERVADGRLNKNLQLLQKAASGEVLSTKEKSDLRDMSMRELEGVEKRSGGHALLEKASHLLSKNQIEALNKNDKFDDAFKEHIRHSWNENSEDAPLVKAQKILADELRDVNASLRTLNVATLNPNSQQYAVGTGAAINKATMKVVSDEVTGAISALRSNIRSAPRGTPTVDMQRDLEILNNVRDSIKRHNDEMKEIPPEIGGSQNRGEYVAS